MKLYEAVPHMNGRDWLVLLNGTTHLTVHRCGASNPKADAEALVRRLQSPVVQRINEFESACHDAGYTDTGDALELLAWIRQELSQ